MKKSFMIGFCCLLGTQLFLAINAQAQNWTSVTAANITDLNQQKLAAGQLCFVATDQNDNPISIGAGGGGQVLRRQYCAQITAGGVTAFTVPNPANTQPGGVYYRVTVKDSSTGQEVLRYTQVSFSGASFNFDTYAPINLGTPAPLSGNAVTGNLSVSGNVTATGTVTASNIPASILQQIFDSGTGLTQRTSFNCMAGIKCADNAGTARTDLRLGTLATVTFSATPIFDASTASTFKLTLTGNVTSSTLASAVAGEPLAFEICQDATGGRTFVPPANLLGWVTIPTGPNACVLETFIYDGTNAQADGDTAGQVLAQDGNASAPSIAFENATNMGFYKLTSTCFATGISSGNQIIWCPGLMRNKSGGFVGFSANADPNLATSDAGIFRSASGILGVSTAESPLNTAGEMDMRTLGVTGSTSGKTSVVTDAAASGTATLKAGTYNVVGDTLAQTLTSKTLNGASNGNSVTLLNEQGSTAILTGNSTDQVIYTYTMPANTLAAGKGLRVTVYAEHDAGSATISWKVNFGGTAWTTVPLSDTTPPVKAERFECLIFNNAGVTNAQHGSAWVITNSGGSASVISSGSSSAAVATTSSVTITFTFNVASTDQARGMQFLVELIQ